MSTEKKICTIKFVNKDSKKKLLCFAISALNSNFVDFTYIFNDLINKIGTRKWAIMANQQNNKCLKLKTNHTSEEQFLKSNFVLAELMKEKR